MENSTCQRIRCYQSLISTKLSENVISQVEFSQILTCLKRLETMEISALDIESTGVVLTANNLRRFKTRNDGREIGVLAEVLARRWHGIVKEANRVEELKSREIEAVGKFRKFQKALKDSNVL